MTRIEKWIIRRAIAGSVTLMQVSSEWNLSYSAALEILHDLEEESFLVPNGTYSWTLG